MNREFSNFVDSQLNNQGTRFLKDKYIGKKSLIILESKEKEKSNINISGRYYIKAERNR